MLVGHACCPEESGTHVPYSPLLHEHPCRQRPLPGNGGGGPHPCPEDEGHDGPVEQVPALSRGDGRRL